MRMLKALSSLLALLLAVTLLVVPTMASPADNGTVEQEPLAGTTEPEPDVAVTDSVVEIIEPGPETVAPEPVTGGADALTPEGNMTLVDNIDSGEKQFIVVQSRNGYYFYIIIDHASEGDNTVHFLNQVDEADLLALTEGEAAESAPAVCTCTEKCTVGAINTSCEVCAVNMGECVGAVPDPEPGPETTEKPDTPAETDPPEGPAETGGGVNPLMIVVVLAVLGAGGAVAYLKFFRKKPKAKPNLDDYDYSDDDNEDSEDEDEPEGEDDDPDENDLDEEAEDE